MHVHMLSVAVLAMTTSACREPGCRQAAAMDGPVQVLPDIAGFAAAPEGHDPAYRRRDYVRAGETVSVILASFPMNHEQYRDWLRMSTAYFPQAELGIDASRGNGFYQCTEDTPTRCNLLLQLSCGLHIEIRGSGTTARRRDADDILLGLTLPRMAETCAGLVPMSSRQPRR
jgi:hypothetical protein